jgi:hypothetical protein
MGVLKRRSRIVSFRLSQEEYEAMKEQCISHGARSISDYARTSACRSPGNGDDHRNDMETALTIHSLRERVEELDNKVRQLGQFLDTPSSPQENGCGTGNSGTRSKR